MNKEFTVVVLTEKGLSRVLNGSSGMTFPVDMFTQSKSGPVAHIRDYRYPERIEISVRPYCIWTLAAGDYTIIQ